MKFAFPAPAPATVSIESGDRFPVRRIFCIGRNYADHVREMGGDAARDSPVFFTKPADAVVESDKALPLPPMTNNLHYEGELVVALERGGHNIACEDAASLIFGYAAGCDLTRRDLQAAAKSSGGPWDLAKAFDHSAPVGSIRRCALAMDARLTLTVNGETRQSARLLEMIWSVPEIIAELSKYVLLAPGDLIFTGTPAGVGPLSVGDVVQVRIGDLPTLDFAISEPL